MTSESTLAKSTLFWTIVAAVAAVLSLVLDPVRAFLGLLGHGVAVGVACGWGWLGASHGVPGWLLALLVLVGVWGMLRLLVWVLTRTGMSGSSNPSPAKFTRNVDGVEWKGHITHDGLVLDDLIPYCPHCHFQIRPAHGRDFVRGGWFTQLRCEDCGGTDREEAGNAKDTYNRIARRIEAQWRRDDLKVSGGQ